MEFADIKALKCDGFDVPKPGTQVPSYKEASGMPTIRVNDLLQVASDPENRSNLESYVRKEYRLVPIRRMSSAPRTKSTHFPYRVLLEITSRCNLLCVMCPRNVLTRPQIDMPKEVVKRCLDELAAHQVDGLWLYNIGESMMHPDFEEIFLYCQKKAGLGSLWLSTNGQKLTDRNCELLIDSDLTFLNFSLNAMDPTVYKTVSPDGNYALVLANLSKLIQMKEAKGRVGRAPWLRIQMIDQPQASGQIDEFLQAYAGRAEILSVNLLEAFDNTVKTNIAYAKTRERAAEKRCRRIDREDAFVFADGEVGFCDTDFNHLMTIGNIGKASLETIWGGEARRHYQELNRTGRLDESPMCQSCMDYDL